MRLADKIVVAATMISQLACGAPQISGEKRDTDSISASAERRTPEMDIKPEESAPEVSAETAKYAAAVEKCLQDKGGRIALEISDNEAYIAETIRPTGVRPEAGTRVGQYFMCNESNNECGVAYGMPNQFSDSFGPKFERWGLEARRFHDVSQYPGKIQGADGLAERSFDFNLPPKNGHQAICMPMPDNNTTAFVDTRLPAKGIRARNDFFGCTPAQTPKLTRAYFQSEYQGILAKLAQACADNKVYVPGSKYVRPDYSGAKGFGHIDTGGTRR